MRDHQSRSRIEKEITSRWALSEITRPVKAVLGLDLVCIFDSEDTVRKMNPDQTLLTGIEGRIQNAVVICIAEWRKTTESLLAEKLP